MASTWRTLGCDECGEETRSLLSFMPLNARNAAVESHDNAADEYHAQRVVRAVGGGDAPPARRRCGSSCGQAALSPTFGREREVRRARSAGLALVRGHEILVASAAEALFRPADMLQRTNVATDVSEVNPDLLREIVDSRAVEKDRQAGWNTF
jgi:hypothetical protein